MDNDENFENLDGVNINDEESFDCLPISDLPPDEIDHGCQNTGQSQPGIEWNQVHATPSNCIDYGKLCYLPGQPVHVEIINVEYSNDFQLSPYLYTVQFKHGDYVWKIVKRYKNFLQVHEALLLLRLKNQITVLKTAAIKEKRKSVQFGKKIIPKFPRTPDRFLSSNKLEERKKILEEYLAAVLQIPLYKHHSAVLEFLEICHLSFVNGLGEKRKEGIIKKRAGGRLISLSCCDCGQCLCCPRWHERWLIVKDTFIAYLHPDNWLVSDLLLMDNQFQVYKGKPGKHILNVSNATRKLVIKCKNDKIMEAFYDSIIDAVAKFGTKFTTKNLVGSFAPIRGGTPIRFFIDGSDYMSAIADAIEAAKEEIFIADWWLSPEVYLKRPMTRDHKWRLDVLLKRKADSGVKIFVQLFKEVKQALGINSYYTKETLIKLHHENIKVLRHPDGIILWSHHEKCVVIDQKIAFLGGIDLCYGRWDTQSHLLTDLGSIDSSHEKVETDSPQNPVVENIESRSKSLDIINPQKPQSQFNRCNSAPTPSPTSINSPSNSNDDKRLNNNVSPLPTVIENPATTTPESKRKKLLSRQHKVIDQDEEKKSENKNNNQDEDKKNEKENNNQLNFNFSPKLNSTNLDISPSIGDSPISINSVTPRKKRPPKLVIAAAHESFTVSQSQLVKPETPKQHRKFVQAAIDLKDKFRRESSVDLSHVTFNFGNSIFMNDDPLETCDEETNGSRLWIGKDYTNFIFKDFVDLDKPFTDFIDRSSMPRMPWHDIGCSVYGKAARDVARHFIQRWNYSKIQKCKYNRIYQLLIPKSYNRVSVPKYLMSGANVASVQVLRSSCSWSAGLGPTCTEKSIHEAYVKLIDDAKHYIYIENQFFVSIANSADVRNRIADSLFRRIKRAHEKKEVFRVFVVMPLLPGFEGEFGTSRGTSIQAVTHWNYMSICRGNQSLTERILRELVTDPSKYISFFGLRTHEKLNGKNVTELIYVHSKLMIVDDMYAIIGSANINDRSMIGDRDSELGVLVQDVHFFPSKMNGHGYEAGKFCGNLRINLFKEHLGVTDSSVVQDPVLENFYKGIWLKQASINTSYFEKVFKCIPSDSATNFFKMKEMQTSESLLLTNINLAETYLNKIQGHIVLLPYFFLKDEELAPTIATKEGLLVPTHTWT